MRFNLARHHVASDNPLRLTINDNEIKHLCAWIHFDLAQANLSLQGLIGTEQQLLTGLSTGIKGTGNLCSTEGSIVEHAAIFAGKWDTLSDTLVDDVDADLR